MLSPTPRWLSLWLAPDLKLASSRSLSLALALSAGLNLVFLSPCRAIDGMADLAQEQAQEKVEMEEMRKELRDIKGEVRDAMGAMNNLQMQQMHPINGADPAMLNAPIREYHLIAKESPVDVGGMTINALTYNGKIPGPEIHASEGDLLKIVLHNNLKVPTSLHFHGLILPHKVDGLPRASGTPERYVKPGDSHVYQFPAGAAGTYYYHPQIVQQEQRFKGMYGALIVHPRLPGRPIDRDIVLLLAKADGNGKPVYLVNGLTAPHIPAIDVKAGERIKLRVINNLDETVPLHLSGHRLEVTGQNGSDPLEPRVVRDTVAIQPSERIDMEFLANNPGVWSLASELPQQNTSQGRFPGGIAIVLRYNELKK